MSDDYRERIIKHHEVIDEVAWNLLCVAKRLCPGDWVLQIEPNIETKTQKHIYLAIVSNGDDNVTGTGETISTALADLILYLLRGSVFPLGGNGGAYIHPADRGWIKKDSA